MTSTSRGRDDGTPPRTSLAWRGLEVALLAGWALWVALPTSRPELEARVRGDALVLVLTPPGAGAPAVLLDGDPAPVSPLRGAAPPTHVVRGLAPGRPRQVTVHAQGSTWELGGIPGEPPAVELLGLAGGRRLRLAVRRPVLAAWHHDPRDSLRLPAGELRLAAPEGPPPWQLDVVEDGIETATRWELAPILLRQLETLRALPEPAALLGTKRHDDFLRAAVRGPSPLDDLTGWEPELAASCPTEDARQELASILARWRALLPESR